MRKAQPAEDRARLLVESMPHAIVIVDEDGTITEVNSQTLRWFGYERRALVGKPVEMLIPERLRGPHAGFRAGYARNPTVRLMGTGRELFALRKDGSEFPVDISLSPIRTERGIEVIAAIADVTDRKQAEAIVRESESRFRTLLESLPHALVIVDEQARITEVNSQTLKWFQYEKAELIGRPVELLLPERNRKHHVSVRDHYIANPSLRPMGTGRELFGRRKDGVEFPVDISLSPIRTQRGMEVIASIADITDRKRMESALRESHERYKALLRALPVGVMIHREFRPLLVNQRFAELLGFDTPEEFERATEELGPAFFIPEETRAERTILHRRRMAGEALPSPIEWETVRRDGTRIWLESWLKIVEWDDGAPAMEAVHVDITERRTARARLQLSEEGFRAIFERAPVAMAQMDRRMVFVRVNQGFADLTGYTVAELTGMSAYTVTPPGDRAGIAAFVEKLFVGTVPDSRDVRPVLKRDGSIAHTEATRSVITDRDGSKSVLVMLVDITERLRAEDALRKSEEAFRTMFENAPVAIISYGRDLRLTRVNRSFAVLVGYSEQELIGMSTLALIPAGERDAAEALANKLFEGNAPAGSIVRGFCTRAGNILRTEVTRSLVSDNEGNPSAIVMLVDITERLHAEAVVRESAERFQRVFDEGPVPMTIVDRDMTFVRTNEQFCRMLGYAPPELDGKNVRDVTHAEDIEEESRAARDLFEGRSEEMRLEKRFVTKSGAIRVASLTRSVLKESSDAGRYAISIIEDITDRKRAERELLEANRALGAANRELESFAYSVSHDLRQPLRAMSGFSHALAEDYAEQMDDTGKDYMRRIERAVARMTQLIDDMLSLSRITRAEIVRRPVDVTAMCWGIVEELRTNAEERQVNVLIQPELTLSADPGQLNALLRNLLGNAWKFSSKNPRARVEVGQESLADESVLFVRDNGVGFDMKYADQLFAPFQRLHAATEFPGTGIGLATVQRVVAKHGGRVWAESKPGEGTTIRFTL